VKLIRWTPHALKNLADREMDREQADRTLEAPEFVVAGQAGRKVFIRRYFDTLLQQEMLLRIIKDSCHEGHLRSTNGFVDHHVA
jgi:hypothetical protein